MPTFLLAIGFFYLLFRINKIEKLIASYKERKIELKENEEEEEIKELEKAKEVLPQAEMVQPQPEIIQPPPEKIETPVFKEPLVSEKKKVFDKELEFKIGSKIATGIGALAVILGIGFFIRYAFENNLINETMRVVLGLLVGSIFLVAGEFIVKRFSTYGQIITGAGLGILYLSLYAAFNVYEILPQPVAFLGMIIVTAIGVFLAIMRNSIALAGFAQVGGFITPLLLSAGTNNPHALFIYLAILNIGIVAVSRWKLWRFLSFSNFALTVFIYIGWFLKYYTADQIAVAEGYASLFFLIFLVVSILQYLKQKSLQDGIDVAFAVLNPAFYFLISYRIISPSYHEWMGLFTALLGLVYLIIALFVKNPNQSADVMKQVFSGIGFVSLMIAVPIQFDKIWIAVGWAIEAALFSFLGFQIRSRILRIFAQGVFLASLFHLFAFDRQIAQGSGPFLNERFLAFIIVFLSLVGTLLLYVYKKPEIEKDENATLSLLLIGSGLVFLTAGSLEIINFFPKWLLSLFWSLGAVLISIFAFYLKDFPARMAALLLTVIAVFRLFSVYGHLNQEAQPWLNPRFYLSLVAITALISLFCLYKNFSERLRPGELLTASSAALSGAYFISLWSTSMEISDFYKGFWLPVLWFAGASVGCFAAFSLRNTFLRLSVYATLIVAFFHLLAEEGGLNLYNGAYTPVLNTRVLTFLIGAFCLGIILLLIKNNRDKLAEKEISVIQPSLFLGMNFLLFFLLSSEIIDYFKAKLYAIPSKERMAQRVHFENLRNTFLSVGWTLYAITLLAIGILKKFTAARFLAIFLFGIVILKVFLYDTANLNDFYRFVSYITLGLILLLTGYLYYRYRDRITQFIKGDAAA